jgi:hypothetical protein
MNENWTIKNNPFEMLDVAFKRLFPDVKYKAYFEVELEDENGEDACGLTDFKDNGEIIILVDGNLSVYNATEIFAHELAHAAVGEEHDHDEVWEKAFSDLHDEYNKIGSGLFGKEVNQ